MKSALISPLLAGLLLLTGCAQPAAQAGGGGGGTIKAGTLKTMTLIGRVCKRSDALS